MNASAACLAFPPEPECGGRGVCALDAIGSLCVCEENWASIGDFAGDRRGPCLLWLPILRAEWAINLAASLVMGLVAAFSLFKRLKATSRRMLFRGGAASRGLVNQLAPYALFVIQAICFVLLSALKLADPAAHGVGVDVAATVLFSIGALSFWTAAMFVVVWLMNLAVQQVSFKSSGSDAFQMDKFLRAVGRICVFLGVLEIVFCLAPIIMLANSNLVAVSAGLHGVGLGFVMTCGVTLFIILMSGLIVEIHASLHATNKMLRTPDDQLKRLAKKLSFGRWQIGIQGFANGLISFAFGLWPLLTNLYSYYLPLAWTVSAFAGLIFVFMTTNRRDQATSSVQQPAATLTSSSDQARAMHDSLTRPVASQAQT